MSDRAYSRTLDKIIVRLPDGMRDRLAEAAAANKRSVNAEVVARLQQTLDAELGTDMVRGPSPHPNLKPDLLGFGAALQPLSELIADAVAKRLRVAESVSSIAPQPPASSLAEFDAVLRAAGPDLRQRIIDKIDEASLDNAKLDQIIADFVGGTKAASTRERHAKLISELEALVSQPNETPRVFDLEDKPAAEEQPTQPDRSRRLLPGLTDDTPSTPTPKRPSRAR